MRTFLTGCLLSFVLLHSAAPAEAPGKASQAFDRLVDQYFDFTFKYQPTFGTESGFHQYDTELEDFAPGTIAAEIAGQKDFLTQFAALPRTELAEDSVADLDFLVGKRGAFVPKDNH